MSLKKNIYTHLPGILIILAAIIIGLATYQHYGISWDEYDQRNVGNINYDYAVHNKEKEFREFSIKEYGAGFEMLLIIIERRMHISDNLRDTMLMRHLVTHLFFLLSLFAGYMLMLRLFKSQFIATLGLLMLLLYPPIYAHSYFNTKDLPLLSLFIISFAVCQAAFSSGRPLHFLLLGVVCGFTTSIRVLGILPTVLILFFLAVDIARSISSKQRPQKFIADGLLFVAGFLVTIYVSWPFLWGHPIDNFIAAYNRMAHYGWDSYVMLNGEKERSVDLPWTYFPTYFLVTTPVLWLIAAAIGIICLFIDVARKPLSLLENDNRRNFIIYFAVFTVPVAAVIYLHSVLYDGWRHLYFIYPAFVLLALYAINKMWQTRHKLYLAILCYIQVGYLCYFMVVSHPLQHLYFNELVSHDREYIRKHYDFDYWGTSCLQALNYLLAKHPYDKIMICNGAGIQPVRNNIGMLKPHDRERIEIVDDCSKADYFITNYRLHPEDFPNQVDFKVTVLNSSAVCVYKVH